MSIFSKKPKIVNQNRDIIINPVWKGWSSLTENNPTVIFCETLIANSLASLPLNLYAKKDGGRVKAAWIPSYTVCKYEPNPYEVPHTFYAAVVKQIIRKGNCFIQILRTGKEVDSLYILDADSVKIELEGAYRTYYYKGTKLNKDEIIHIPSDYGYDGVRGKSILEYAKSNIELSNKLQEYLGYYLENSLNTKLEINVPYDFATMDDSAKASMKVLQDGIQSTLSKERTGKPLITFKDMTAKPIDLVSSKDSELVQNRELQDKLICLLFNVPYSMLTNDNKYNSLEANLTAFYKQTISSYAEKIEQYFTLKLIPKSDRSKYYFEFDYNKMLRTDINARFDNYTKMIGNGLASINECRSYENMDSIGSVGDYRFLPANLMPLTEEVIQAYMANAKLKAQELNEQDSLDNKNK